MKFEFACYTGLLSLGFAAYFLARNAHDKNSGACVNPFKTINSHCILKNSDDNSPVVKILYFQGISKNWIIEYHIFRHRNRPKKQKDS